MNRIVLLARKLDQGGTGRQIVTLAKAMKKKGSDVHVLLFYMGGVFDDELAAYNLPPSLRIFNTQFENFGLILPVFALSKLLQRPLIQLAKLGDFLYQGFQSRHGRLLPVYNPR